ncbi:MAG TPA: HAD hydrolase family protein [Acidimicrobiales bacterium]|nr:HAD hydrolase family protein [Acidimicrobiales bacterium]
MIRLVVTDLDGTLWLGDGVVPQSTREAMAELERRQIPLLAATARRSWSAAHFFQRAKVDLPAVLLNGALGRDKGGGPTFHQRTFDQAQAALALDVFIRHGVSPCANFESGEWDVVSGPAPSSGGPYLTWAASQLKQVDDLSTLIGSLPVYAFSVVACPDATALHAVRDELARSKGIGMVNVFADKVFGGWTLDCAPRGVNKWSGVEAYCRYGDIDPGDVLAVGDGDNDVELLRQATRSCAMSHATDKARAAAQVTLSGGMDGWGQLLDYL